MKNKKVFDFIYILKDEWQKLEKEKTALFLEEIEMIHKIENIRSNPNYIEAKIYETVFFSNRGIRYECSLARRSGILFL
ncbi:hypothetical protein EfmGK923_23780 [Enterococcus faecium]|uniref:hypothetical protein n=1 Tax=Enterococcus faecium TaxID=1352 RepID=UPI002201326C|nr:hypothetical protein [Enterococcus faecium]BDP92205.1 hypothetical protein EfmGK923_23780 [Enterococcus faecium]